MTRTRASLLQKAAGGPDRTGRRWMTTVAAAVVPALLVVLAFVNPGVKVAQVDLHDGSVWITARSAQKLGRFNAQIKELNGGVVANRDQFDVLQSGPDVLLVEAGAATVVDPAAVSLSTPVALPAGAAVAMDAGTVAVTSPEGGLWVSAFSALAGISLDPGAADATLGAGAVTVVTKGGAALAFDPTTGKVTRVEVVDGEKVVTTGPELEGAKGIVPEAVAAVGDALVVLAAGRLHADGWVADLSSLGGVVLQQTGPSHEHVLLGSPSGLVRVSLDDGEVAEVPTGGVGHARGARIPGGLRVRRMVVDGGQLPAQLWRRRAADRGAHGRRRRVGAAVPHEPERDRAQRRARGHGLVAGRRPDDAPARLGHDRPRGGVPRRGEGDRRGRVHDGHPRGVQGADVDAAAAA
ncbi:hypothetical protein [Sanguibacter hominis]|uniref:hypothetical protein n=1 Tax=Sanguibacter hominis TaxID=1312739 RepID=UPI0025708EE8|nr:hypothetical protein [Sanguibacter hominis]